MTVQDLLEKLRDYPRDMEVVLMQSSAGVGQVFVSNVSKLRMKEVTLDEACRVASDEDFDNDVDLELAVVIYPEA